MRNILILLLFALLITSGCRDEVKCEKEVYLLPKDFHGRFVVFFNQADGAEKCYEGDARLYTIPSSGILKSQFQKNGGCMNNQRLAFFYVDSLGKRESLHYFLDMEGVQIPADENYIVFTLLSDKMKKTEFVMHLVGNASEFQSLVSGVRSIDPEKLLQENQ